MHVDRSLKHCYGFRLERKLTELLGTRLQEPLTLLEQHVCLQQVHNSLTLLPRPELRKLPYHNPLATTPPKLSKRFKEKRAALSLL